jgi:putative copper export protein
MGEAFLLIVRWLHAIAAVTWVGGGIFYWAVLKPALRTQDSNSFMARVAGPEFGQLVSVAMGALILTGSILAVDRLSEEAATGMYGLLLGLKILASAWMFGVVLFRRRPRRGTEPQGSSKTAVNFLTSANSSIVVGLVVFFLSDLLRFLIERNLAQ